MVQNGSKPEDETGETNAPEVEAEVVADDHEPSPAFDDPPPEVEDALDAAEAELSPRKSTLTPGVMLFLAFVAVALIALAVWRFMPGGPAAGPGESDAAVQETPGDETAPVSAQNETLSEPQEDQRSKIDNLPADNLQAPGDAGAADGSFLPPVTEAGANKVANSVEAGAKEAMRRMQEAEEGGRESEQPSTDEITGFDVDAAEEAPGADPEAAEEPGGVEETEARAETSDGNIAADLASSDGPERNGEDQSGISEKITNELQSLRDETARLESAFSAERERNAALQEEIANLRDSFEAALAARDQQYAEELSSMRADFEKIRNTQIEGATDRLKATLALNALRRKVDAGEPFVNELTAVAEFAPDEASILAPYAHDGVPADTELRASFGDAARAGLAAAGQEKAGGGVSGLVARAQSLVSVRPAEPQAGDTPRAVISRAEHAVREGDLTYALSELDTLSPAVREAMKEWTEKARARSEAEAALARLARQFDDGGSR